VEEARRHRKDREKTYRERALKMYPHICARCGREFSGKRLRELTVHHKDHNHDNNPGDGSNWELLCLYCHDNEHARQEVAEAYTETDPGDDSKKSTGLDSPFANLAEMLKEKGD
jgi:5-methylcytosine-specific restriction endonuclease McrA